VVAVSKPSRVSAKGGLTSPILFRHRPGSQGQQGETGPRIVIGSDSSGIDERLVHSHAGTRIGERIVKNALESRESPGQGCV
jgi:hypothetical protein